MRYIQVLEGRELLTMHCQKQTQFNVTINQNQEIHKLSEALLDGSNQIIGIKSS